MFPTSRVNSAPESALFDATGAPVMKIETPDLGPLMELGFKFPEPFTVKADDGVTDLYGVMYKPFDFDPNRKYPIIAYVYPGPQTESVTKTFNPRSNNISLAQFGFVVIEVGMAIAADPQATGVARLAARRQVEGGAAPDERAGERLLLIADPLPQRVGQVRPAARELPGAPTRRLRDADLHQLMRRLDRQRPQPHCVEQLKDGRVGADAKRQ